MKCAMCGEDTARIIYVTEGYGEGDDLLVIEHVPLVSCRSCGQSYYTAKTLHAVDRIRKDRHAYATERPVAVAVFEPIMQEA
jgi:YgiT-type zinc finger domain-containing protein